MRVYLPLTLVGLAAVHRSGEVGPAPLTAYAVTPDVRAQHSSGSEEEWEYAALGAAAEAALRLLAADPAAPPRRVVLAADVADTEVAAAPDAAGQGRLGEVRLAGALPVRLAAAVHVDAVEAAEDVAAAAAALDAADGGDETAGSVVDGAADHELLWYGVQEIDTLL